MENEWLVSDANRARWRTEGVLHVVLGNDDHHLGQVYDEADGRDALGMVDRLIGERDNVLNLTDIRRLRKTTAAVRRLPSHPKTARLAFLVGGPVSRMLGNAYLGITKLPHATRLFTDEASAVSWLLEAGHGAS